jgi:hypothetical protein
MRHYHRTHVAPAEVLTLADAFFAKLGLNANASAVRSRTFSGPLGTMTLTARPEGGHYTFVEAVTDQIGESRLDKNVKKFFVEVHRYADPQHVPTAGY